MHQITMRNKKALGTLCFLVLSVFFIPALASAAFNHISAGLTGVEFSSVAWGDYDNDGDLDLVVTGYDGANPSTKLYGNNGDGTFTEVTSTGLPGVYYSAVAWGDYDNDGDLDLLLTGYNGTDIASYVCRNNGDGTFTDISAGLTGVEYSSVAWGDYDNDGDLDILLTGEDGPGQTSKVYKNNGDGTFTELSTAGLTGVKKGGAAWGDYDNDGDLDILLTGEDSSGKTAKVYKNNGDGTFTDASAGLTAVYDSAAAWGDYDNDGDLDILLTGHDGTNRVSQIYTNNGDGTFTELSTAGLTGVMYGSVAWGDYDNDGDLDILLTGHDGTNRVSQVYTNNGDGTFTDASAGLTAIQNSSAAWGDYDNDGDLDIALAGDTASGDEAEIYKNDGSVANELPYAPASLTGEQDGASAYKLSWQAPSNAPSAIKILCDEETPAKGLNYNLYIGTSSGAIDVASPMSNIKDGYRRLPAMGLVQNTTWSIKDLKADTLYYWSVQAIDTALAGGPFASEGCFRLDNNAPTVSDVTKSVETELTFSKEDFLGGYSDADNDAMTLVRIKTLPESGQLLLDDKAVTAGDEIKTSQLDKLVYKAPTDGTQTQDSFTWQARDCTDWSADPAKMILDLGGETEGGGGDDDGGGGCFAGAIFH